MKQLFFILNDDSFVDSRELRNELLSKEFASKEELSTKILSMVLPPTSETPFKIYDFKIYEKASDLIDDLDDRTFDYDHVEVGYVSTNSVENKDSSYWYGVAIVTDILKEHSKYLDLSCDDMFAMAQVQYDNFLQSDYNVDEKSEYLCILDFINNTL